MKKRSILLKRTTQVVHERNFVSGITELREKRGVVTQPPPAPVVQVQKELAAVQPAPGKKTTTVKAKAPHSKLQSMTKPHFELIREWDWKERKLRLESWRETEKTQKSFFGTLRGAKEKAKEEVFAEELTKYHGVPQVKSARTVHEGLVLKRELEKLSKIRIRDLEQETVQNEIRKQLETGQFKKTRVAGRSGGRDHHGKQPGSSRSRHKSSKHKHHHHHHKHRSKRHHEKMKQINKQLDMVMDKSRQIELRKTFGRGWDNKSILPESQSVGDTRRSEEPATSASSTGRHRKVHKTRTDTNFRTDIEEEQPHTSYVVSRGSSDSSLGTSVESMTQSELLHSVHWRPPKFSRNEDSSGSEDEEEKDRHEPLEFQDMCFGNVRFVERSGVEPVTGEGGRGVEFFMSLGDTALGIGMGKGENIKVNFFKPEGPGIGHKKKRKEGHKKDSNFEDDKKKSIIKNFNELPEVLNQEETLKRLSSLERTLKQIPGISSGYMIQVQKTKKSQEVPGVARLSRRTQFTRPARRIWFTPLPLTNKKYYRTNWKRIKYDVRKQMKGKNYWPKLWINFEESHPKKLHELIHAKVAVKRFAEEFGFQKTYDWAKGVHPDYVDWILEDIVPHQGNYYYEGEEHDVVRRASLEDKDFKLKDWFVRPPRYVPESPISPPFDMYDFCQYGNRRKPYFLAFTLPREILHYYAPPSNIAKFFRQIPKPPYAFPGYAFKRWLNYPLEQKLPQYYPFPKRFMSWTRGKIGDKLQCSSADFKLDDPLILKRDLKYSVYHDPHATRYTLRKDVLDRIWEVGLINSKGEVMCTMYEFNKNREYLRDYEWLEECVRRWNVQWTDRQQHNRLTKKTNYDNLDWEAKTMEWNLRLERCKDYTKIRDAAEKLRYKQIQEKYEKALQQAVEQRQRIQMAMMARARKHVKAQKLKRKTVCAIQVHRTFIFRKTLERRHKNAEIHRRKYYLDKIADKIQKQKETWSKKVDFHQQKVFEMKEMQMRLDEEFKVKAKKHHQRIVQKWEDVPFANVRRRLQQERGNFFALKYGRRWLEKARQRKKNAPDHAHLSLWSHGHHLTTTVQYLEKESGYVHADDFFFNAVMSHSLHHKKHGFDFDDDSSDEPPPSRPSTRKTVESSRASKLQHDNVQLEIPEEDTEIEDNYSDSSEKWYHNHMQSGYEADEDEEEDWT